MSAESTWLQELDTPTERFFAAFAARVAEPEGVRDALREAVRTLIPRIDWEAYQPHFPHGLLGLRSVLRLRPLLSERSFLRALATQLHMAAHEGRRSPQALAQVLAAKGSGHWRNLEGFIQSQRPALAYAEAQGIAQPTQEDCQRLGRLTAQDMANVGHKAVVIGDLGDLLDLLGHPKATGRRIFGLAAWLAATPEDTFWARRAAKRLVGTEVSVPWTEPTFGTDALLLQARDICDLGLVSLLDRLTEALKAGQGSGDTLAALVLAASEKQLDARRDLEGRTAWTFAYLANLVRTRPTDPRIWCQAAALVNLFPTDEPEHRLAPVATPVPEPAALREAVLDLEPTLAMGQTQGLVRTNRGGAALATLAETASQNDPTFNHAQQVIAVAAGADLLPQLPPVAQEALLMALAKHLAQSQGSGDLGRQAQRTLAAGESP